MLSVDSTLTTALDQAELNLILLVAIDLGVGGIVRLCDAPYPVTVGGSTFQSTDPDVQDYMIVQVSVPEGQQEAGRDLYQITFSDPNGTLRDSLITYGWAGIPVDVLLTFYGADRALTPALEVYTGVTSGLSISTDDSGVLLTITCSGQLAQLDGSQIIVATSENQALRDADDNAFDHISTAREVIWGRAR